MFIVLCPCEPYLESIAARMDAGLAPALNICIESRATSMQIAHPYPCESHSMMLPSAARCFTKQSWVHR